MRSSQGMLPREVLIQKGKVILEILSGKTI